MLSICHFGPFLFTVYIHVQLDLESVFVVLKFGYNTYKCAIYRHHTSDFTLKKMGLVGGNLLNRRLIVVKINSRLTFALNPVNDKTI